MGRDAAWEGVLFNLVVSGICPNFAFEKLNGFHLRPATEMDRGNEDNIGWGIKGRTLGHIRDLLVRKPASDFDIVSRLCVNHEPVVTRLASDVDSQRSRKGTVGNRRDARIKPSLLGIPARPGRLKMVKL